MRARVADLAASIDAKKLYQDERLALSLARETSRLTAMGGANGRLVNGH
jgi:predicted ATPase